jgi:hypothetical protein
VTDIEIIKAFESCYLYDVMFCDKCPNKDTCGEIDVAERTLDLINRQQAEIEMKNISIKGLNETIKILRGVIAGIEYINEWCIQGVKSEAVKEFAEKLLEERLAVILLKDKSDDFVEGFQSALDYMEEQVKNLLKEMGQHKR